MGGLLYEAKKRTKKSFAVRKFPKIFGFMYFLVFFLKKKTLKIGHFAYRPVIFLDFLQCFRDIYLNFKL